MLLVSQILLHWKRGSRHGDFAASILYRPYLETRRFLTVCLELQKLGVAAVAPVDISNLARSGYDKNSWAMFEAPASPQNPFQKLALHLGMALSDEQLDNGLAPLLRNQPTVQVIKKEDASVRRIVAVLKAATPDGRECGEVRRAYDARVERAVKAVALLRDRYEWRARVDLEDAEKEELDEGGDGDVTMTGPEVDVTAGGDSQTPIGSTPGSEHTDEANEAREAEDVLGQGTTPG